MIFWIRGHVTNRKSLYLHVCNIYGHQIWQSGNLRWRELNFKVMGPSDYVVTWQMKKQIYLNFHNNYDHQAWPHTLSYMTFWLHGYVANINPYIYTPAVLMTTKPARGVTCGGWIQSLKTRDVLMAWSPDKFKKTYICTFTISMGTKLGRLVTYGWKTSSHVSFW